MNNNPGIDRETINYNRRVNNHWEKGTELLKLAVGILHEQGQNTVARLIEEHIEAGEVLDYEGEDFEDI